MKALIKGLQVIINLEASSVMPPIQLALQTLKGGANAIQLRHKGIFDRQAYMITSEIAELCSAFSVPFLINDRVDIALAVEASGVHLGQTDLPISVARRLLGSEKIIGATASTIQQAQNAVNEGADYIGFGHIFPTITKLKSHPPLGVQLLEKACRKVKIPLIAIGGINLTNLSLVCEAGVAGVAVISAITSPCPLTQTENFKTILKAYEKE